MSDSNEERNWDEEFREADEQDPHRDDPPPGWGADLEEDK